MTRKEKFLWGGFGGIVTLVLSGLRMDYEVVATVTFGLVVFWTIRTMILFLLGGFSTFFHKTEEIPVLIQLGVAAPMLFAGYVNQNTMAKQVELKLMNQVIQTVSDTKIDFVPVAYAEDDEKPCGTCESTSVEVTEFLNGKIWDFEDKEPNISDAVKQAFTGLIPRSHYLILGERDSYSEARRFALSMLNEFVEKNLIKPESLLTIRVFKPYKKLSWSVVCSRRLSHQEADTLAQILVENQFTPRIYDLLESNYIDKAEKRSKE